VPARLRYRRRMKKLIREKLRVSGETIRLLATHEITHAAGGGEIEGSDTGRTVCAMQNVGDLGRPRSPFRR
jgi:hypothetical protein